MFTWIYFLLYLFHFRQVQAVNVAGAGDYSNLLTTMTSEDSEYVKRLELKT